MATNKGPLRKIIAYPVALPSGIGLFPSDKWGTGTLGFEVYECGHVDLPKQDIYGDTFAVRRRCRFCRDGKPQHVTIEGDKITPIRKEATQ
jgi:hypothetical protein